MNGAKLRVKLLVLTWNRNDFWLALTFIFISLISWYRLWMFSSRISLLFTDENLSKHKVKWQMFQRLKKGRKKIIPWNCCVSLHWISQEIATSIKMSLWCSFFFKKNGWNKFWFWRRWLFHFYHNLSTCWCALLHEPHEHSSYKCCCGLIIDLHKVSRVVKHRLGTFDRASVASAWCIRNGRHWNWELKKKC